MRARVDSHDVVRVLVLALAGCEKKKKFPTVLSVHFAPHRCREELRARLCERVPIMALMSSSSRRRSVASYLLLVYYGKAQGQFS